MGAALHSAVLDQSGRRVRLYGQKHYGMSIRSDWHPDSSAYFEEVETITIDDAAERLLPSPQYPPCSRSMSKGPKLKQLKARAR